MKTIAAFLVIWSLVSWSSLTWASENSNAEEQVTIKNYSFDPATVTVKAGTTVTWVNRDDVPHTVTSTSGKELSSQSLDTGVTYSHTFTTPGTYDYYCSIHTYMKGTVIVQ